MSLTLIAAWGCGDAAPPAALSSATPTSAVPREPAIRERAGGRLVFLGDSLTSGYNLAGGLAYPSLIQGQLDQAGLDFEVVNAGVSGDTSAGALRRLEKVLDGKVRLLMVAIGGNDGLRGQDLDGTRRNIASVLSRAREKKVATVLAAMEIPPNYGPLYTSRFRDMYPALAREFSVPLIPFMLDGVAGDPALNLEDGIHPNARGHSMVATIVWKHLEPMLRVGPTTGSD